VIHINHINTTTVINYLYRQNVYDTLLLYYIILIQYYFIHIIYCSYNILMSIVSILDIITIIQARKNKINASVPTKKMISLKEYITILPKVELHVHLEGMITKELYLAMGGKETILNNTPGLFDKFGVYVNILCQNFDNNMGLLLEYVFKDRYEQNIFYTQFQYSPLKIHEKTSNTVRSQFDIIIKHCANLKKTNPLYNNIMIDFILDIPRGNADVYSYFTTNQYLTDIINLSKEEPYKYYIRGIGIGGRIETNTMKNYDKFFKDGLNNNLLIIPHGGEFGTNHTIYNSIHAALKFNVPRIGHGIRIIEHPDLIKTAYDNKTVFDVCITSNLNFINEPDWTKTINNYKPHPIYEMINKGLLITLASDDPGLLSLLGKPVNLVNEYIIFSDYFKNINDKKKYIDWIALNGIEATSKIILGTKMSNLIAEKRKEYNEIIQKYDIIL